MYSMSKIFFRVFYFKSMILIIILIIIYLKKKQYQCKLNTFTRGINQSFLLKVNL